MGISFPICFASCFPNKQMITLVEKGFGNRTSAGRSTCNQAVWAHRFLWPSSLLERSPMPSTWWESPFRCAGVTLEWWRMAAAFHYIDEVLQLSIFGSLLWKDWHPAVVLILYSYFWCRIPARAYIQCRVLWKSEAPTNVQVNHEPWQLVSESKPWPLTCWA